MLPTDFIVLDWSRTLNRNREIQFPELAWNTNCAGLGAVSPALEAGTAAPLSFLTSTVDPVTATVAGLTAKILFAGLTPGLTGLYQVNLEMPGGLLDNDLATLVLTVSGQSSSPVSLAVRK